MPMISAMSLNTMPDRIGLILIFALIQVTVGDVRREWVPSSMTAAEMWNPATWYYPYGIAAAESWADYLKKAQEATNQLYQQWHATGAQWGWWYGGQSQMVPGGGANNTVPGQGAGGQVPGVNGQNQGMARPMGQNQSRTTPRPGQNQGSTAQTPRPGQSQGSTGQTPRPGQSQGSTAQTPRPGGQYVPIYQG